MSVNLHRLPTQWLRARYGISLRNGLTLAWAVGVWTTSIAQPLGLVQAYEAARQHDPVFQGALAELDAGRQFEPLARSLVLPTVQATYNNSHNQTDLTQPTGGTEERSYRSYSASLQARHPLYHPEGRAVHRQGKARTAASEARFLVQQQDLILRLFEAYTAVLSHQEQLRLAQAQLSALQTQSRANEQLLVRGEGTRTDVLETQAKLETAQAQLIEVRDQIDGAQNKLAGMIGGILRPLQGLAPGFDSPEKAPASLQWLMDTALQQNPLLISLRHDLDAAKEEVRRAESGHTPRVDLVANASQSESDTVNSFRQTYRTASVGVQLSIPLYAGGAVVAQTRQAIARQRQAQAQLDAKTTEVLVEVQRQHQLQHSSGLRMVALLKTAESGQLLIEATRKSVAGGVRTNLDLLNAQERLTQTQRDLALARFGHLLASIRLRSAAGVLSEADLNAVAGRFSAGD